MILETYPTITAHRGGSLLWVENSMEAHKNIRALPVDCIECDIHESNDGYIVVFHDNTLERLTENGHGDIAEHSFKYLRMAKLKYTLKDTIFLLETLFNLHKETDYILQVELKTKSDGNPYPHIVQSLVKLIKDFGYEKRVIPISFSLAYIKQLQNSNFFPPSTQFLLSQYAQRILGMDELLTLIHTNNITVIGANIATLSYDEIVTLKQNNISVSVWGANDEHNIKQALALPLVNITSDRPDLALQLRESSNKEKTL